MITEHVSEQDFNHDIVLAPTWIRTIFAAMKFIDLSTEDRVDILDRVSTEFEYKTT